MSSSLIQKYNTPGPRYTSYPTVPYWEDDLFTQNAWRRTCVRAFNESNDLEGISLYIHLPFCEELCTFCACNRQITKRHSVEEQYIDTVLKEWGMYLALFEQKPKIKELHLGGGTPTFFSPENLKTLIEGILAGSERMEPVEFSLEGHPNNTTEAHLRTLFDLGFRRISFGVQDYDPVVQKAIKRNQTFDKVRDVTEQARAIGFNSVCHDLVFGLPFQTKASILDTIEKTQTLSPDRIALYSYAHVPWIKGVGQRGFDESNLPSGDEKRALYELCKTSLQAMGYVEIGMDHFAKENDTLNLAAQNGQLHRNFMGYSASKTELMIGLGASSISDSWYSFAQNEKSVKAYARDIDQGQLSVFRGHILTCEDLVIRQHILNLMCRLRTSFDKPEQRFDALPEVLERLVEMQADGLLILDGQHIQITEKGRPYARNICMAFDVRLMRNKPDTRLFSMTV